MWGKLAKMAGTAMGAGAKAWGGMSNVQKGAIGGAAIGGLMGADNGSDGFLRGAAAGALGGAAFGKFGACKNLMGRGNKMLSNSGAFWNKAGRSGGQMLRGGRMTAGLHSASLCAQNFSNKHGDKVLAGLGAGAAGLIGSSAMSSNRPL